MKKILTIKNLLAGVFIVLLSVSAYSATMTSNAGPVNSEIAGPQAAQVFDQSGTTPLPIGRIVQYIYAGTDGIIQAPTNIGGTTGDDRILNVVIDPLALPPLVQLYATVGKDAVTGADLISTAGYFFYNTSDTYEASNPAPKIYVRAYNSNSISSASYYGNSALFAPSTSGSPNDKYLLSWSTNQIFTPPAGTPNIATVEPVAGVTGSTPILIKGSNFGTSGTVRFKLLSGSTYYPATVNGAWSDTSLSVIMPAAAGAGLYEISVVNNSAQVGTWQPFYHTIPYISSISPSSGPAGSLITLTGSNFATATSVHFNYGDTIHDFNVTSITINGTGTQITFNVPAGAIAGSNSVFVTNPSGNGNSMNFALSSSGPLITTVSETLNDKYYIGHSYITIEGTAFGAVQGASTVTIGGVTMTPISGGWTDTKITGLIPTTVAAGSRNVIVTAGTASNSFSIVCYPYVTGIAPNPQMAGTSITISGYGFGASQGTSTTYFNGTAGGSAISWGNTSIVMNIPMAATSGLVSVEVNPGGLKSNGINLIVTANTNAYIDTVTQPTIYSGDSSQTITVHGTNTNFTGGTVAYIQYIAGTNVSCPIAVTNGNQATVTLNVPANTVIVAGSKRITLVTGSQYATGDASVGGTAPVVIAAPTVGLFSPASSIQNSQPTATITGTGSHFNLVIGDVIAVSGLGVTAEVVAPAPSATSMSIKFYIDGSAAEGDRTVTISSNLGALGTESFSPIFTVTKGNDWTPDDFVSDGGPMVAYPNPFNPLDTANPLKMLIGAASGETVAVYILDSNARIVWEYKGPLATSRIVTWDGETAYGETAHNGLYLVRAVSGSKTLSKGKILVIKKKP